MKNCDLEGADNLPRCFPSQRLRYEKQTKTPSSFCSLPLGMLHGGKAFENEEYKEGREEIGGANNTYKSAEPIRGID